jgi:hypothetical protein
VRLASWILVLAGAGAALAARPRPAPGPGDRGATASFRRDVLRAPLGAERRRDALGRALRRFIPYDRRLGGEFTAGRSWRVLLDESAFALLGGAGSRGFTNSYVVFRPTARGWGPRSPSGISPETLACDAPRSGFLS